VTSDWSVDSLSVRLIKNSVVYPTIPVASHPGKLLMGVYDEDDYHVYDTALNRRSAEQRRSRVTYSP
jgi:hypothetical protein